MNYYSYHIGDLARKTAHLSILEEGVYRRLIDRYFTYEAPIMTDEPALCRLLRARSVDEKEAVHIILQEFFNLADDGWRHADCDEAIAHYRSKSAKASDAANKRWGNVANAAKVGGIQTVMDLDGESVPMPTHSASEAYPVLLVNQEPLTNNSKPRTETQTPQSPPPPCPQTLPHPPKARSKAESTSATRLPADWEPSDVDLDFCELTRPELTAKEVALRYRDYWIAQPGMKGRKADWPATWRNWVRNERAITPVRAGSQWSGPQWLGQNLIDAQRASTEEAARMLFGDSYGEVFDAQE